MSPLEPPEIIRLFPGAAFLSGEEAEQSPVDESESFTSFVDTIIGHQFICDTADLQNGDAVIVHERPEGEGNRLVFDRHALTQAEIELIELFFSLLNQGGRAAIEQHVAFSWFIPELSEHEFQQLQAAL